MNLSGKLPAAVMTVLCLVLINYSCSKNDGVGTPPVANPCANVNLTVSAATDNTSSCDNSGKITATATGTGTFVFSIDGSNFQASGDFVKVAKGTYTVTVKNNSGCTATTKATVNENPATPGPFFLAAKSVISANCVSCHNPAGVQPNPNWAVDCNIVNNSANIKIRAVDQGTMPPTGALSQADKDKISAWINAGGKLDN